MHNGPDSNGPDPIGKILSSIEQQIGALKDALGVQAPAEPTMEEEPEMEPEQPGDSYRTRRQKQTHRASHVIRRIKKETDDAED